MHRLIDECVAWLARVSLAAVGLLLVSGDAASADLDFSEVPELIRYRPATMLDLDEIQGMSANPYPAGRTREKFEEMWIFPTISNEAFFEGSRPRAPRHSALGDVLRVASWNLEWSLRIDEAIDALTDRAAYIARLDPEKAAPRSSARHWAREERELLAAADVLVLQELDVGLQRSGYRDAARDIARALEMNYAYVPEYVEVDPVLTGLEPVRRPDGSVDEETTAAIAPDPERFRGLFGMAVLSRYPIVDVQSVRLFNQCYDWYWQEMQKISYLENAKRFAEKNVFLEQRHREIKVGGRPFFRVDLFVPQLPEKRVSIINVHLEIKCLPEQRAEQIAEILQYIEDIDHPVILAGDFNSAPYDMSATSTPRVIRRNLEAPEFWLSRAVDALIPTALFFNMTRTLSNLTKNFRNPTASHIPVLAPNPNAELFRLLERFRFRDGGAFDFRGSAGRTAGHRGRLANSNERDWWAYTMTYRVKRPVLRIIGTLRLDWIFVKSRLKNPYDADGPYRFAPHFGRTLSHMNRSLHAPISDHDPIIADLPFAEPRMAGP